MSSHLKKLNDNIDNDNIDNDISCGCITGESECICIEGNCDCAIKEIDIKKKINSNSNCKCLFCTCKKCDC